MCHAISDQEDRISVWLIGSIGVKEATSIRQELFPRIQAGFTHITFHLGEVTDMDSSGLGLLLAAKKIASDINASVTFLEVPTPLRERLILTGIII
ncbi:STAS domain-containing protein [Cohnella boryungensis]|uniref:STAS domain-containing protein n=1 Tax=Cohnella boryungensis TaxID=768479 RepID=A0ABV8SIC4_9BACL